MSSDQSEVTESASEISMFVTKDPLITFELVFRLARVSVTSAFDVCEFSVIVTLQVTNWNIGAYSK